MPLMDWLYFVPFVVAFFFIWHYMKWGLKKQHEAHQAWREFANLKGLREQPAIPEVSLSFEGENQGVPFTLECLVFKGTPMQVGNLKLKRGDDIKIFTRMKLQLPRLPRGLRVYRETAWSKIGKGLGMQDIRTGDQAFDQAFMVKGNNRSEVISYLTPSRRMALLTYAADLPGVELQQEGLILLQPGQIGDIGRLERYFSQLGSLAAVLISA